MVIDSFIEVCVMKSNYKRVIQNSIIKNISKGTETVKRLWELETLLTLHREFGFGKDRLKRFANSLNENYKELMSKSSITDTYKRNEIKLSNIDTAIIMIIRELRKDGIDHREILGTDEELVIIEKDGTQQNLDEFVDKMEKMYGKR